MSYVFDLDFNPLSLLSEEDYPLNPKTIGKNIRKRKVDLGLEQNDVAKIIGVTESSIWNWGSGMKPVKMYEKKIERFLGYSENRNLKISRMDYKLNFFFCTVSGSEVSARSGLTNIFYNIKSRAYYALV